MMLMPSSLLISTLGLGLLTLMLHSCWLSRNRRKRSWFANSGNFLPLANYVTLPICTLPITNRHSIHTIYSAERNFQSELCLNFKPANNYWSLRTPKLGLRSNVHNWHKACIASIE